MEEFIFMSKNDKELSKENFNNIKNNQIGHVTKPDINTGLWASLFTHDNFVSEWHEFVYDEMNYLLDEYRSVYKFELKFNARIFTIDNKSDLCELAKKYKISNINTPFLMLDFEKMCDEYDAIHLTSRGQELTRFGDINLYGWDVDSLLILNFDCINLDSIKPIEL